MPQCVCPRAGEGVTGRLFDARDNHRGTVRAHRWRLDAGGSGLLAITFGNKLLAGRLLREWGRI